MTQYISKEKAIELAKKAGCQIFFEELPSRFQDITGNADQISALCNAAIEAYLKPQDGEELSRDEIDAVARQCQNNDGTVVYGLMARGIEQQVSAKYKAKLAQQDSKYLVQEAALHALDHNLDEAKTVLRQAREAFKANNLEEHLLKSIDCIAAINELIGEK